MYEAKPSRFRKHLLVVIVSLSVIVPMALLYCVDAPSFDKTWKGRTFYMFFVWLFAMELILDWEKYGAETERTRRSRGRLVVICMASALPTIYVVLEYFFGLDKALVNFALAYGVGPAWFIQLYPTVVPLAAEYIVLAILYVIIFLLAYGLAGLKDFSISAAILATIGFIYATDNLYPQGSFTPFQIIVPTTARLAAWVLNNVGFWTRLSFNGNVPILSAGISSSPIPRFRAAIDWPCSGVESLLIYTIVMLLFLRRNIAASISPKSSASKPLRLEALRESSGVLLMRIAKNRFVRRTVQINRGKPALTCIKRFLLHALVFLSYLKMNFTSWAGYFLIGALVTYFVNILRIVTIYLIGINGGDIMPFHDYYGPLYSIMWITSYPLIIIGTQILWKRIRLGGNAGRSILADVQERGVATAQVA